MQNWMLFEYRTMQAMFFKTIGFLFYRLFLLDVNVVNVEAHTCMKREIFTLVAKGNNAINFYDIQVLGQNVFPMQSDALEQLH